MIGEEVVIVDITYMPVEARIGYIERKIRELEKRLEELEKKIER